MQQVVVRSMQELADLGDQRVVAGLTYLRIVNSVDGTLADQSELLPSDLGRRADRVLDRDPIAAVELIQALAELDIPSTELFLSIEVLAGVLGVPAAQARPPGDRDAAATLIQLEPFLVRYADQVPDSLVKSMSADADLAVVAARVTLGRDKPLIEDAEAVFFKWLGDWPDSLTRALVDYVRVGSRRERKEVARFLRASEAPVTNFRAVLHSSLHGRTCIELAELIEVGVVSWDPVEERFVMEG